MLCVDIDGLVVSLSQKELNCGHAGLLVSYHAMLLTMNYASTRSEDLPEPLGPGAVAVMGSGDSRLWYFVET